MPLFEIESSGELVPFRQRLGGPDLYEDELEQLIWDNIEEFLGESLFRVRRQAPLDNLGRPDIVALDRQGAVVVIEVKRDVARGHLAQCLEYAGWARTTSLDELAGLYHGGHEEFWSAWQEYTESSVPVRVLRTPRLVLVARDFQGRTAAAFDFLIENHLPVQLIRVSLYEDAQGRNFVDVEGDHEPDLVAAGEPSVSIPTIDGRRVRLDDLFDAGLLHPGDPLVWERPRLGDTYRATVAENGSITLADGRTFASPSRAAMEAANIESYDGWYAWRVDRPDGKLLLDLRAELISRSSEGPGSLT